MFRSAEQGQKATKPHLVAVAAALAVSVDQVPLSFRALPVATGIRSVALELCTSRINLVAAGPKRLAVAEESGMQPRDLFSSASAVWQFSPTAAAAAVKVNKRAGFSDVELALFALAFATAARCRACILIFFAKLAAMERKLMPGRGRKKGAMRHRVVARPIKHG